MCSRQQPEEEEAAVSRKRQPAASTRTREREKRERARPVVSRGLTVASFGSSALTGCAVGERLRLGLPRCCTRLARRRLVADGRGDMLWLGVRAAGFVRGAQLG